MTHTPIKIFVPEGKDNFVFPGLDIHSLPFDIESDKLIATSNFEECDAVPIMGGLDPDSRLLDLLAQHPNKLLFQFIFSHISEGDHTHYSLWYEDWSKHSDNVCTIITDYNANKTFHKCFHYDFLFNRQKAYYVDYEDHVKNSAFLDIEGPKRLWSGPASSAMYFLTPIEHVDTQDQHVMKNTRKFIVPNKNDITLRSDDHKHLHERTMYRHLFTEYVNDQSWDTSYYCDWSRSPPVTLPCEQPNIMESDGSNYSGWWPISNSLYDTSIINAYVETLVNKNIVRCVTEKTFEPIIKGNFILPFGYQGIVNDIVEQYGFQLPNWIDYSYDSESDRTKRFYLYTREFLRLRDQFTTKDLLELRNKDIDILRHNRQVFFDRPYHSLYDILRARLKD